MFTYVLIRVIHIASAAVWFALPLGLSLSLRRASARGTQAVQQAAADADRRNKLSFVFGVLVLATGLLAIFRLGGFPAVHRNIHMALGLVVLMLVFHGLAFLPVTRRIARLAADGGEVGDRLGRLAAFGGVLQLLWVIVLGLMYWR